MRVNREALHKQPITVAPCAPDCGGYTFQVAGFLKQIAVSREKRPIGFGERVRIRKRVDSMPKLLLYLTFRASKFLPELFWTHVPELRMRYCMRSELNASASQFPDLGPCKANRALEAPRDLADISCRQKDCRRMTVPIQDRKGIPVEIPVAVIKSNGYQFFQARICVLRGAERLSHADAAVTVFVQISHVAFEYRNRCAGAIVWMSCTLIDRRNAVIHENRNRGVPLASQCI